MREVFMWEQFSIPQGLVIGVLASAVTFLSGYFLRKLMAERKVKMRRVGTAKVFKIEVKRR